MSILIAIVITFLITHFGKHILNYIIGFFDIIVEDISKEEACKIIMEKDVNFKWQPQIVSAPIISNIIPFKKIIK